MSWLKLRVETEQSHAEAVADFLEQFGASAVSFCAASSEKIFAEPHVKDSALWLRTEVSALLPVDVDMDILLVCLKDKIGTDALLNKTIEIIEDQDWVKTYRHSQQALIFGNRLCICPSWLPAPETELEPLILDPGLAFGTGTHATTALCLEWLATADIVNKTILDFGCGSGILGLASARLGAKKVYAIDIDPLAITACQQNAETNGLQEQFTIARPDQVTVPQVDILLANVLLSPLKTVAEKLAHDVKTGGIIILSGILANQIDECLEAYEQWFMMSAPILKDEWGMLYGVRRARI